VDNYAFQGEVSPVVVVALLLGATTTAASLWGRRGWIKRPPRGSWCRSFTS